MSKENFKQAVLSIFIGCCVTFIATLFEQLAQFLQDNSTQVISGAVSSAVYLAKAYRV
jgi:hypothetical protein